MSKIAFWIAAFFLVGHTAGCGNGSGTSGDAGGEDGPMQDIPVDELEEAAGDSDLAMDDGQAQEEALEVLEALEVQEDEGREEDQVGDNEEDGEAPAFVAWAKTFGGGEIDGAHDILQTPDGGFLVAGETGSFGRGAYDLWIIKLDEAGNALWQASYGGPLLDDAQSIDLTTDGNVIVAGATESFGAGTFDFWVLKLDLGGYVLWQRAYGGAGRDDGRCIDSTSDGGYVVAGWTDSFGAGLNDYWIVKLDSSGDVEWQRTYGGEQSDMTKSVQQVSDGGYVAAGWSSSFSGNCDVWILRLDEAGDIVWQKTYGGADGDIAYSIREAADGGFLVAGQTGLSAGSGGDAWFLKLDSSGDIVWQKAYGGSSDECGYFIHETTDRGIIALAAHFEIGYYDMRALRFDPSGALTWEKSYGMDGDDTPMFIYQVLDGGYILAGYAESFTTTYIDAWVLKLDPDGMISASCPAGIGTDCSEGLADTSVAPADTSCVPGVSSGLVTVTNAIPGNTHATVLTQCTSY